MLAIIIKMCIMYSIEGMKTCYMGNEKGFQSYQTTTNQVFTSCSRKVYRRFIMNKEELVKEISKKTKLSQKISSDVLSATLDIIQKTVAKGKKVTLVGFGTWEARKRAARIGRNPQTGKELKIAAKTVPAFSAGKSFKELVK